MSKRTIFNGLAVLVAGLGFSMISCASKQSETDKPSEPPKNAVAVLSATKGNNVEGTITLTQMDGYVRVQGEVRNLKPGKHGFHIHEFGDLRDPEGKSAGGHYNPEGAPHGGPDDSKHHVGDLGNIEANDKGVAQVDKQAKGAKLHFLLGRSIVVHGGADDLKSQPAGDAGPRVGLGVIGLAEAKEKTK